MSMKGGILDMNKLQWKPDRPFNELPSLLNNKALESSEVLRACVGAGSALGALDMACRLIPSPEILVRTLPLLEAQASSEIENIVTSVDDLFQHVQSENEASPAVKEALRYRRALVEGAEQLASRPLTTRTAELVCSQIKGAEMTVRKVPGTRLVNESSGEVVYTPPEGEAHLRGLLSDWEQFCHEEGPPNAIIRMAAAHYQFEAIHPFTDGNGRTGRILMSLYLVESGLLSIPVLYLSRHIIRSKGDYYRLLRHVTRTGEWEPWLLYMIRGVEETARWTADRIGRIRELQDSTAAHARSKMGTRYSRELTDLLFAHPYVGIADLIGAGIAARVTGAKYLRELVQIGILEETAKGKRRLFRNTRLMRLLTREDIDIAPFE